MTMNVQIVLWVFWCLGGLRCFFKFQLISHSFRAVHARHASAQDGGEVDVSSENKFRHRGSSRREKARLVRHCRSVG